MPHFLLPLRHCGVLLSLIMLLSLSGCNFHLRGFQNAEKDLSEITLFSFDRYNRLTRTITKQLNESYIKINSFNERNDIPSLRIISATHSKQTASIFRDGKTAEYKMIIYLTAEVLFPNGDLIPISLTAHRAFFDNPTSALAKDAEQDLLITEMEEVLAQDLVRRILVLHSEHKQKKIANTPNRTTVTL